MKKRIKAALSTLLFALALAQAALAEAPKAAASSASGYAEIVFAQGDDIVILRSSRQIGGADSIGTRLVAGDQIQTGAKSSVELVLMPRRSRLRLSENTVVTIRDLGGEGSTGLELLYGRIRSKVEKLADVKQQFEVSSHSYVASVRGTDFGCDALAGRQGELAEARVYCFEGSVEVKPADIPAADAPVTDLPAVEAPAAVTPDAELPRAAARKAFAPIIVAAGAMAVIEAPASGKAAQAVEKPIDVDTSAFWKVNDFTSAEPVAMAVPSASPTATAAGPPAQETAPAEPSLAKTGGAVAAPTAPAIDLRPIRNAVAIKNAFALSSLVFLGTGIALEGLAYSTRAKDSVKADSMLEAGMICMAMGTPWIVFSIAVDPLRGHKR